MEKKYASEVEKYAKNLNDFYVSIKKLGFSYPKTEKFYSDQLEKEARSLIRDNHIPYSRKREFKSAIAKKQHELYGKNILTSPKSDLEGHLEA